MKRWTKISFTIHPLLMELSSIMCLKRIILMRWWSTVVEVQKTIQEINTEKAPVLDAIPLEIIFHGCVKLAAEMHHLISDVWSGTIVSRDWVDANLILLNKGVGYKSDCGNYRGINLLEVVSKMFAKLQLNQLTIWICISFIQESHCGFKWVRCPIYMNFSACQLQEKCIEHRTELLNLFADLTRALDMVNWTAP